MYNRDCNGDRRPRKASGYLSIEDFVRLSFFLCLALMLPGFLFTPHAAAEAGSESASRNSPVGRWKTVDDATGKAKSIVTIWEQNGKLYGKVQQLLDPATPDYPNPRCDDCPGEQKGRPVVGLRILWDMKKDGDGWSGGMILDPETGKTYRCLLSLADGGKKLKVRGYLGLSVLGRTQYWQRE